jgi:hypothetical protein
MDFDAITESVKKAFDAFMQNIVVYIVGFLIAIVLCIFIITIAPLIYGLYYMIIKGTRGEKVEIKDVFYGFSSLGIIIRSWIGVIVYGLIYFIVSFIIGMISAIIPSLAVALLISLVSMLISLILTIFLYYTLYIYVMTPSENIIYAIKESVDIGKSNIIMVFLTIVISYILSILIITWPLGALFAVYMLKELKPEIKDESGI